jgi:hypothetical protein
MELASGKTIRMGYTAICPPPRKRHRDPSLLTRVNGVKEATFSQNLKRYLTYIKRHISHVKRYLRKSSEELRMKSEETQGVYRGEI